MVDSALVMISKTYDQRCETAHFAMRTCVSFLPVLGLIGARNETDEARGSLGSDRGRLRHRAGIDGPDRQSRRPLDRDRLGGRRPKKLRKRAVKPMKSLARVNLCAGLVSRDGLTGRSLLPALMARRRRIAGPAVKADGDRIEVRELKGRHRQIDRIGHNTKLAGLDPVRRRLGPVGLGKDRWVG